ncbi:Ankyrin repeats (3 copies) [Phytophthora infestans]|uniref:Ankyrin repeats (3 copies) n=1 Tax=Phytophthora infestans TaxID=4787 RepID=A0A833SUG1_PHYIN|nr:Ankyrin repeats (3 copies) [Phytophthora infestans]
MPPAKQKQDDEDGDDRRAVERRHVEYLRRHREQIQQRYRLEAERRGEEQEMDAVAMRARRDEIRAAKRADIASGDASMSALRATRSLPGIYARMDDLGEEELQLLANRFQKSKAPSLSQTQLNPHGKYHTWYVKDAYPIAGSRLKLEKEREMEIAAKRKLLLTDASSIGRKTINSGRMDEGVLSLGLERARGCSKLEQYFSKLTTSMKSEQEKVRQTEDERQIRLCEVQHRQGLEQFWRLMRAAPKCEVIAWLTFHSFVDVNVPVSLVSNGSMDKIIVREDRTLGVTPLMAACRSLCVELVRCLLDQGAVVWLATANGDTALHFLWRDWTLGATDTIKDVASLLLRSQRLQGIVVALIAQGVNVNAKNAFGETALQFCARYNLLDCAKLLLRHGADAFTRDRKGHSSLDYARDNHYESLYQLLLHYNTIERVGAREKERQEAITLLDRNRGALTATWSQTPKNFFSKLEVEQARAGHLRNQYVDCRGQVIVCPDEDE